LIVIPAVAVIAVAVGILWRVDRLLHAKRPPATQWLRMLGLAYGSAVRAAWSSIPTPGPDRLRPDPLRKAGC
jgi:hypothetical protein